MDKFSVEKMDRLSEQFAQIIDRHESCFSDAEMVIIFKVFRRFKQYENTELLPEEIEDICNRFAGFLTDMTNNRMSKLNYTLDAMIQCARDAQEDDCMNFCEYQIASMENRLIAFPCAIGETIYYIRGGWANGKLMYQRQTFEIVPVHFDPCLMWNFESNKFSAHYFLTKKAAQEFITENTNGAVKFSVVKQD